MHTLPICEYLASSYLIFEASLSWVIPLMSPASCLPLSDTPIRRLSPLGCDDGMTQSKSLLPARHLLSMPFAPRRQRSSTSYMGGGRIATLSAAYGHNHGRLPPHPFPYCRHYRDIISHKIPHTQQEYLATSHPGSGVRRSIYHSR